MPQHSHMTEKIKMLLLVKECIRQANKNIKKSRTAATQMFIPGTWDLHELWIKAYSGASFANLADDSSQGHS